MRQSPIYHYHSVPRATRGSISSPPCRKYIWQPRILRLRMPKQAMIYCRHPDPNVCLDIRIIARLRHTHRAAAQPAQTEVLRYLRRTHGTCNANPTETRCRQRSIGIDRQASGTIGQEARPRSPRPAEPTRQEKRPRPSLQKQLTRMESRFLHLVRECELLRQENQLLRRDRESSASGLGAMGTTTPATFAVRSRYDYGLGK